MANRTLLIEGWRHLPHSYALISQHLCLEFLRVPGLALLHRDVPYYQDHWRPVTGLFPPGEEAAIRAIPTANDDTGADVVLRTTFPFNWTPVPGRRVGIVGTTEYRCLPDPFRAPDWLLGTTTVADLVVVTPSRWSRDGFLAGGLAPSRVEVVPLGVDPAVFHPLPEPERVKLRITLGWDGFAFLAVGAMTGNKGLSLLLKAFASVLRAHPEVRLILKGLEALYPSREFLLKQAAGLTDDEKQRVQARLTYLGQTYSQADLVRLYQAADAYVSPYFAEGFNLPVLEAIACGTLVICTEGGPTDDFTRPDFALPIHSTREAVQLTPQTAGECLMPSLEHLTQLMTVALERPDLAARARVAGPAFVANGFTWQQVAAKFLSVLFP